MGLKDHRSCRILPRECVVSLGARSSCLFMYAPGMREKCEGIYGQCSTRTSAQVGRDVGPTQIAEKIIRSDA